MTLFGRSQRHGARGSSQSTVNLAAMNPVDNWPPPPYQPFPDPRYQQPPPVPFPNPYAFSHLAIAASSFPHPQQHDQIAWAPPTTLPPTTSYPPAPHPGNSNGRGMYDYIGDKFSDIVSLIDEEIFPANEREVIITFQQPQPAYLTPPQQYVEPAIRGGDSGEPSLVPHKRKPRPPDLRAGARTQDCNINVLSKLALYDNSRLSAPLPPLRLYMPSWPLVCLAAKYSNNAYKKPAGAERDTFVSGSAHLGTKAMVIKSVPVDDMNTIVFAIRGTSLLSLRDWGVNMSTKPVSPANFLDDPGNLCHEGFLRVARAMVIPIATRLRSLLQENPSRASCSLLITGHSAGGAVAALLYSHMLATTVQSELNILTSCFKRIHCVTFGAPPLSLLPLWKPDSADRRLKKSLFLAFVNEGDVVTRAELPYLRSLIDLLASPAPNALRQAMNATAAPASSSRLDLSLSALNLLSSSPKTSPAPPRPRHTSKAVWTVPPATLSNAGRLVLLRVPDGTTNANGTGKGERDVTASVVTDAQLREVVFGNPLIHAMDVYARRVDVLATRAVTGRDR